MRFRIWQVALLVLSLGGARAFAQAKAVYTLREVRAATMLPGDKQVLIYKGQFSEGTLEVFDLTSKKSEKTWKVKLRSFATMSIAPKGDLVIIASTDGKKALLSVFDLKTGDKVAEKEGHDEGVRRIAVAKDGTWFATASRDKTIKTWTLPDLKEKHTFKGDSPAMSVAISPDGKTLVYGGFKDRDLQLFDAESGEKRLTIKGDNNMDLAIDPDQKWLAVSSWRGSTRLLDFATGKTIATLSQGMCECNSLHPDGNQLAVGDWKGKIVIWDVSARKELTRFNHGTNTIEQVQFSPGGGYLLSLTFPRELRIWEVPAGK